MSLQHLSTCENVGGCKVVRKPSQEEVTKLQALMWEYTNIFSEKTKTTNMTAHHIDVQGAGASLKSF